MQTRRLSIMMMLFSCLLLLTLPTMAQDESDTGDVLPYRVTAPPLNPDLPVATLIFTHTGVDTQTIALVSESIGLQIDNLDYGEVTPFINIPAGNHTIVATDAVSGQEAFLTRNFAGGSTWLVTAVGLQENFSFQLQAINILRTDYDDLSARVRVVNLAPNGARTTLTTDEGNIIIGNRLRWNGVGDVMLPTGSYTFEGTVDDISLEPVTLNLNPYSTYLVVVSGSEEQARPFDTRIIQSPRYLTQFEVANRSDETVDIYIRPMPYVLLGDMDEGDERRFDLPSGAWTFIAYDEDEAPDGRERASLPFQFDAYKSYMIEYNENGFEIVDVVFSPDYLTYSDFDYQEMSVNGFDYEVRPFIFDTSDEDNKPVTTDDDND